MKSRIELAVETAMRFLPMGANPKIGRVLFKKDYVYATDGRIAVRIRVNGELSRLAWEAPRRNKYRRH